MLALFCYICVWVVDMSCEGEVWVKSDAKNFGCFVKWEWLVVKCDVGVIVMFVAVRCEQRNR